MKQRAWRGYLYWTIALVFASVLLYFSLRGIHWGEVWQTLLHANAGYVALSALLATVTLFLRSLRWRVLLSASTEVSVSTVFWAYAAGYFSNNFLPARAGEVIRSLMISSATGLSRTFVLTTALSERMCDAISLILISSIVLLTLPYKPGWFAHAATPFAVLGFSGAVLIALLPRFERQSKSLLRRMPLPAGFEAKLRTIMEQIITGMRSFHDRGRLLTFAAYTAIIWLLDGCGAVLCLRAVGLHASLPLALLLITGLGLGSALPSTPGYVGIYQFVTVSVLAPFGFSKADAIAYSFLAQGLQYALSAFWGALGMIRGRMAKPVATT